ncbi:uncharacterized protein LOC124982970 [Sciurus carolinensis]|uniref:uncharacterized protein LOC124982970 n=1 Tax=Sciurus carolinensis TaxID=30640 RepID=UPI001FB53B2D|nr:uncharacterized protein LOC124982970 [Sciurus carolinensis]
MLTWSCSLRYGRAAGVARGPGLAPPVPAEDTPIPAEGGQLRAGAQRSQVAAGAKQAQARVPASAGLPGSPLRSRPGAGWAGRTRRLPAATTWQQWKAGPPILEDAPLGGWQWRPRPAEGAWLPGAGPCLVLSLPEDSRPPAEVRVGRLGSWVPVVAELRSPVWRVPVQRGANVRAQYCPPGDTRPKVIRFVGQFGKLRPQPGFAQYPPDIQMGPIHPAWPSASSTRLPALLRWESHLTSLSLSLLISETGGTQPGPPGPRERPEVWRRPRWAVTRLGLESGPGREGGSRVRLAPALPMDRAALQASGASVPLQGLASALCRPPTLDHAHPARQTALFILSCSQDLRSSGVGDAGDGGRRGEARGQGHGVKLLPQRPAHNQTGQTDRREEPQERENVTETTGTEPGRAGPSTEPRPA